MEHKKTFDPGHHKCISKKRIIYMIHNFDHFFGKHNNKKNKAVGM